MMDAKIKRVRGMQFQADATQFLNWPSQQAIRRNRMILVDQQKCVARLSNSPPRNAHITTQKIQEIQKLRQSIEKSDKQEIPLEVLQDVNNDILHTEPSQKQRLLATRNNSVNVRTLPSAILNRDLAKEIQPHQYYQSRPKDDSERKKVISNAEYQLQSSPRGVDNSYNTTRASNARSGDQKPFIRKAADASGDITLKLGKLNAYRDQNEARHEL